MLLTDQVIDLTDALTAIHQLQLSDGDIGYQYWREIEALLVSSAYSH